MVRPLLALDWSVPAPGQALKPARDVVVIKTLKPATVAGQIGLKFAASAMGDWGNSISVRVTPALGATLSILPDTVNGGPTFSGSVTTAIATFTVTVPSGSVVANNDMVIINNQSYTVAHWTPAVAGSAAGTFPIVPPQPATFTVDAQVSDGLQNLSPGVSILVVPADGSANRSFKSVSIDVPTTVTVTVPFGTTVGVGDVVILNTHSYVVLSASAGQAAVAPVPPATVGTAPVPANFTVTANVFSDGLQSLSGGAHRRDRPQRDWRLGHSDPCPFDPGSKHRSSHAHLECGAPFGLLACHDPGPDLSDLGLSDGRATRVLDYSGPTLLRRLVAERGD